MPRGYQSPAQRAEAARAAQKERISRIIRAEMCAAGVPTQAQLAKVLGWTETKVSNVVGCRGKGIDIFDLISIADALKMPDETRAALLSSSAKGRYEKAYIK